MKNGCIILFILMSIYKCKVSGLTNDYNQLNDSQRAMVVDLEDFDKVTTGKIYKINGEELRKEIQQNPKSLVYIFKNDCTSEYCVPLNNFVRFANKNDYQLYLVMNGYAGLDQTLAQYIQKPLYVIDNEYYNINGRTKYIQVFENDLLVRNLDYKEKEYLGDIFFFEKDSLIEITRELSK